MSIARQVGNSQLPQSNRCSMHTSGPPCDPWGVPLGESSDMGRNVRCYMPSARGGVCR